MLPEIELAQPKTLPEALAALAAGDFSPFAGGTNLVIDLRSGREKERKFVSLGGLEDLKFIRHDQSGVTVGSRTTIANLLDDNEMNTAAPALVAAADIFAGSMVRTAGTIGGNICCGSPSADTVPPLLTLDAQVTLASPAGERVVALSDFYLGYKETVLKPGELLVAVSWKPLPENSAHLFYKLARRKGDAITVTGVSVMLAAKGGKCSEARIALGSVGPTVFRAEAAEALLRGKVLTPALIEQAAKAAADQSSPIDDIRASASYRVQTTHALVRRLVAQAWQSVSG